MTRSTGSMKDHGDGQSGPEKEATNPLARCSVSASLCAVQDEDDLTETEILCLFLMSGVAWWMV
jgi:hypothetical protein